MKKLIALFLIVLIFFCSSASAEELIPFYNIPYEVEPNNIIELFQNNLGVEIEGSSEFFSSVDHESSEALLFGAQIDKYYVYFSKSNSLEYFQVILKGNNPEEYTRAIPGDEFFPLSKDAFLTVYTTLSNLYGDMLSTILMRNDSFEEIQYTYTGEFDTEFWTSIAEQCLLFDTIDIIIYCQNLKLGFQVFSADEYIGIKYSKWSSAWLDFHGEICDTSSIKIFPEYILSKKASITLSIGEWECPAHIPAGEYVVTPIKSASIEVYRDGDLKVCEYLSTDDNDEIGRLALKSGDTIEIQYGKLEFAPF